MAGDLKTQQAANENLVTSSKAFLSIISCGFGNSRLRKFNCKLFSCFTKLFVGFFKMQNTYSKFYGMIIRHYQWATQYMLLKTFL